MLFKDSGIADSVKTISQSESNLWQLNALEPVSTPAFKHSTNIGCIYYPLDFSSFNLSGLV